MVRHPAAFLAGILNVWPMGFYHPATLVKAAQRHGTDVLPIDDCFQGFKTARLKAVGLNQTNMDNRSAFGLWIYLDLTGEESPVGNPSALAASRSFSSKARNSIGSPSRSRSSSAAASWRASPARRERRTVRPMAREVTASDSSTMMKERKSSSSRATVRSRSASVKVPSRHLRASADAISTSESRETAAFRFRIAARSSRRPGSAT